MASLRGARLGGHGRAEERQQPHAAPLAAGADEANSEQSARSLEGASCMEADDEIESLLCSTVVSAPSSCSTGVYSYLEKLKCFSEWNEDVKFIQRVMARKELRRQAVSLRIAANNLGKQLAEVKASRARRKGGAGVEAPAPPATAPPNWRQRERRLAAAEAAEADQLLGPDQDMCYWRHQLSLGLEASAPKPRRDSAARAKVAAPEPPKTGGSEPGGASARRPSLSAAATAVSSSLCQEGSAPSQQRSERSMGDTSDDFDAGDEVEQEVMWQRRLDLFFDHFEPWPSLALQTSRSPAVQEMLLEHWAGKTSDGHSFKEVSVNPVTTEDTSDVGGEDVAEVRETTGGLVQLRGEQHGKASKGPVGSSFHWCVFIVASVACVVPLLAIQV